MSLFIKHSLQEVDNKVELLLFIDQNVDLYEFSKEFGAIQQENLSVKDQVKQYVRKHFPNYDKMKVHLMLGSYKLVTMNIIR